MSSRRTRSPSAPIGWALAASTASSIALIVVYARGGQPQAEGALLAVSLGGIGVALVLWAKRFLPHGPYEEHHEPMTSPARERAAFEEAFGAGAEPIARRGFLARLLGAAVAALAGAAVLPIRSLGPTPGRALFVTAWRPGVRLVTKEGTAISVRDVDVGGMVVVWPEDGTGDADAQTVLIRLRPGELQGGRTDWAPQGFVAYSRLCTHAGCPVGLYQRSSQELYCPCHQSVFDVLDGARPTAGPATRPLPQLPLQIDPDGFLRAKESYPEPVGPGFWNRGRAR